MLDRTTTTGRASTAMAMERSLTARMTASARGAGAVAMSEGDEIARLKQALAEIREEWAGAECGEPVYAQEAYALGLAKRMYEIAVSALRSNAAISGKPAASGPNNTND